MLAGTDVLVCEVDPLGKIFPDQATGIFVVASLPRAVWIGKVGLNLERLGQPLMKQHLFFSIISHRLS